ncbi:SusF/SusE family outer membrane protein [Christiangramia forsetii]|uniref:Secreted protein n=2 Tax=Christiangramia forsetii TaxID=411153 RepID=A0LXC9_CHRFK|nr:SusF/SusE family outer membrane protein [Christiangramia forsetii]GGG27547.1 hypothetical protein GCM10011532_08700 [Christiangramia forsetii]CAL65024.1 secreted protein [Christiangramia forsetii KT0803]
MKKALFILFSFMSVFAFISCEEEENLIFTAQPDPEGVSFENSFQAQYLLSEETASNIAERFLWNPVNFDAPVNVTYDLEASLDPEFSTSEIIGTTSETNQVVTVDQLLEFAEEMGLDADPETTNEDGTPNNLGEVFFRIHAYTGTGAANTVEMYSDIQPLSIKWIEKVATGAGCDPIYVVGAAAVDAGWNWASPIVFNCEDKVYTAMLSLTNDNFRFFETEGDWESGLNYTYFSEEGYTIDPIFENAEDGDSNFSFVGTPGVYIVVVNMNDKTITAEAAKSYYLVGDGVPAGWSWDNPVEVAVTGAGIRQATFNFSGTGAFRVFTTKDDWNSGINYPTYEEMGYTIDPDLANAEDADSNFTFVGEPGTYTFTINDVEKTITIE